MDYNPRSITLAAAGLAVLASGRMATAQTAVALVPPLSSSSAQIGFSEGMITAQGAPAVDPTVADVPGPASPWYLVQWNHAIYTKPGNLVRTHTASGPSYAFYPSDDEAGITVHTIAGEAGLTFSLYNSNGTVTDSGGRATYLEVAPYQNVTNTFDNEIDLALDLRLSTASVSYTTSTAEETGAVLAQGYTGIGLLFVDPNNTDASQFVFMQVGFTTSYNAGEAYAGFACSSTGVPVIFAPALPSSQTLQFSPDSGPLHQMKYNLSAFVQQMLSFQTAPGCKSNFWDATKSNIANWHFAGFYFGTETENTDARAGAVTSLAQGNVQVTADLANFSIQRLAQ